MERPTKFRPRPDTMAWLVTLALAFATQTLASERAEARRQLRALMDEIWEQRLQEDPLFATQVGDHRFDDRLPEVHEAAQRRGLERARQFLERLREIPLQGDTDYEIVRRILERQVEGGRFPSYRMPITSRTGFHVSFPQLPDRVPLRTTQDYENYIARLRDFLRYTREHIALMRDGVRTGWVLPVVVLEGYDQALAPHIVDDPRQSLLDEPFREFPESVPASERERLAREGRRAIVEAVVPAYREFLAFLRDEYVPQARATTAASALPDGERYYAFLVREHTTLEITPREVHDIGLREVQRIRAEMERVMRRAGFEGDFTQFLEFLRTDPRFYRETPEALLKETAYVLKRMDGELPRLFGRLPRMPYGIREIPDYIAPRTTTAYYEPPAGDGTRAGFYYVNTYDLKSRPVYEIEALSLHEAVPGHHLQIALQQELEDLHPLRRFGGFTAFVEGWALYAERLGLEVGFYQDPYSDFGRLTYEMWRALRLVVDTGLHALGWTRQQAIDFMAANSALTLRNITNEVDRYISWPGQALAYKMGELKIRELRERAERELGEAFDIRAFHDAVLGEGALPLDLLERKILAFIERS